MFCSTCGDERLFEQPPCVDGHGADCPERFCADCGEAVLIGTPPLGTPETTHAAGEPAARSEQPASATAGDETTRAA